MVTKNLTSTTPSAGDGVFLRRVPVRVLQIAWFASIVGMIALAVAAASSFYAWRLEQGVLLQDSLAQLGVSTQAFGVLALTRSLINFSLFMISAIVIYIYRSNDRMAIFVSLMLMYTGLAVSNLTNQFPPFNQLSAVAVALLILFLHVFPSGRFISPWSRWTAGLMIGLLIGLVFLEPVLAGDTARLLAFVIEVGALGSGAGFMIYRYQKVLTTVEKQQTKWVVLGFAIAILSFALVIGLEQLPSMQQPGMPVAIYVVGIVNISVITWLLMPLSIVFAVLRYKLWDVDSIINRGLVYTTLTILLGAGLFGSVALLQAGFQSLTGQRSDLIVVAATLLIAAVFMPLRHRLQRVVDRAFFRAKLDFRETLVEFTQSVRANVVLKDLIQELIEKIVNLLYISYGALYLRGADGEYYLAEVKKLPKQTALRFEFDEPAMRQLTDGEAVELPSGSMYTILFPVITSQPDMDEMVGILALGPRLSGLGYSRDDQKLLSSLAAQAGTAIHVAQLAEAQRREVEEANRLKSEFLATMSHELRTPLHAIIGYADVMLVGLAGDLNEEQMDYQERILSNADHLLSLINDVLDIAKIEAGRVSVNRQPFSLSDWLDEIITQTSVLAQNKGLRLETEMDQRLPEFIVGDPNLTRQIAINLISNAIKFTEEGHVQVSLQLKGTGAWALAVEDTGSGIPSHAQEYIFDEFRQVDGSSRREHGGTGLGLSIVRKLALMMGGNVRVDSQVGQGSTFTVLLPLHSAVDEPVTNHITPGQLPVAVEV